MNTLSALESYDLIGQGRGVGSRNLGRFQTVDPAMRMPSGRGINDLGASKTISYDHL